MTLEEIVKTIDSFNKFIRNNAGGAYNHQLFWKMLTPKTTKPGPITLKKINQSFHILYSQETNSIRQTNKSFSDNFFASEKIGELLTCILKNI